jgi:hypothetical protein
MAEVFVPSTTGEGQGAAQIFQSNPQFADASGIVRGIERGAASLAKQREKQYEKELEAQKKKAAQNKLLQDAQNKTNIKELDGAKDLIYQEYVNKAKSDPNFDIEGNFPTLIRDLESVNSLAEGVSGLSKTLSSGSSKISSYINGEYFDNTLPVLQSLMNGTAYKSDEERLKAIQDGTYTQDLNAKLSQAFSDPNVIVNADKGVKDAYDGLIAKAQEQKTITESGTTLDGKPIIRETKKVITNKQIKEALMNDPSLKTIERNKYARENNISPLAVDEHLIENGYEDGFIGYYTELVNYQFPKDLEFTERVGSKSSESKGITEQDLTIAKEVKTFVNEMQDNPSSIESRRNINKFLAPYGYQVKFGDGNFKFFDMNDNAKSGDIPEGDAISIYKFIAKNAPEVKLDAINQVKFEDPTKGGNPEVKADIDAIMKAYANKTQDEAKEIAKKFDGVEYVAADELVIDGKSYDITDEKEANEAYVILEEKGYKKTTRETLNKREAERRGNTEESSNTEEDNNKPEPRKPTLTDAEVKAMYGKKVSREVFKKMTVKQRAKFAQNAGTWE